MEKKQHILTVIIIVALLALAVLVVSIIYDEKIKGNKKAVETISVPQVQEEKVEPEPQVENAPQESQQEEYVGEEEKETQKEERKVENKDEKAIELAKKEWGEDDTVTFSVDEKKDSKYYVAVKQDATVIQWYEVDTNNWTISEY